MKLKANGLLKFIVPAILGIAIFLGIKAFKSSPDMSTEKPDPDAYAIHNVTPDELRELNIQGDTAEDTVKTLLGETKDTKRSVQSVIKQNEQLVRENKQLRQQNDDVDVRISAALEKQRGEMMNQFEAEFARLSTMLEGKVAETTLSRDLGETPSDSVAPKDILEGEKLPIGGNQNQSDQLLWVSPGDMQAVDKNGKPIADGQQADGFSFANVFSALDNSMVGKAHGDFVNKQPTSTTSSSLADKKPVIPVYTLPENSTLIGSVAMTALIGRIPLNGQVNDPYPFKILVGRDNLAANGIDLPDVEGAIISGYATGDWTLSCVQGNVISMTFVFSDGRTRTVPESKSGSGRASAQDGIGWISDPHGIPCIPGDRKTNAPQYLAGQFLLSGGAAAAQGLSQGQTTTVVDGNSVIGAVTGNQGKFILGQALGGGLKETTEWFRQRYGQAFDAIYVPPGHPVAVHLTSPINIDYDPDGRKVKYFTSMGRNGID